MQNVDLQKIMAEEGQLDIYVLVENEKMDNVVADTYQREVAEIQMPGVTLENTEAKNSPYQALTPVEIKMEEVP